MKPQGWRMAGPLCRAVDWEKRFDIFCGVTTRAAGNMKDPAALERFLAKQGFAPRRWAGGEQVHSARVRAMIAPTAPRQAPATDGVVTKKPGLVLRVLCADCVPVFVVDPKRRVMGLFHAGWRGAKKEILPKGLLLMARRFGCRARDLWVSVGPHIQPCCYEIGPEVAAFFKNVRGAVVRREKSLRLDLTRCLAAQARRAGVLPARFSAAPFCTMHDRRFHSFRRDQTPRRMAALAALRDQR
jgi:YfiH family protein